MANIKPVKLAYKVFEPATKSNKTDLILLHGAAATMDSLYDMAKGIVDKAQRKAYVLDMRNHGQSERSDIFTIDAMVMDVLNFMDEHNIERASLIGESMGGRIALAMSLAHPDRIDSIIAEDMTPKGVPCNVIDGYAKVMELFCEGLDLIPPDTDINTAVMVMMGHVFANKPEGVLKNMKMLEGKKMPSPIEMKDGKYVLKSDVRTIRKEMHNLKLTENLTGMYEKPALFLYGAHSEFKVGNDKDYILKLFPEAQLIEMPTSHAVFFENESEFIEAVVKFLA